MGAEQRKLQDSEIVGKRRMQQAQDKEYTLAQSEGKGTCCQTGSSHLTDNTYQWLSQILAHETPKGIFYSLVRF